MHVFEKPVFAASLLTRVQGCAFVLCEIGVASRKGEIRMQLFSLILTLLKFIIISMYGTACAKKKKI